MSTEEKQELATLVCGVSRDEIVGAEAYFLESRLVVGAKLAMSSEVNQL